MMLHMNVYENVPLCDYTTFYIGGKARFFVTVSTSEELKEAILFSKKKKLPFFLLGKGSNTLFDDRGYLGLVILNKINFCTIEEEKVSVGSGTSFSHLGLKTAKLGLSGLEFATGIPASVGGAIYMNAGAMGSSTWQALETVTFLDENLESKTLPKTHFSYEYRYSSFQISNSVILSATFILSKEKEAKDLQKELISYRTNTQPYGEKSAGCIFKNPKSGSAGAMIDQCGLKGTTFGKAKVSQKHANFIVTEQGATSGDIRLLIELVQKRVFDKTGVLLEPEVRMVPYES